MKTRLTAGLLAAMLVLAGCSSTTSGDMTEAEYAGDSSARDDSAQAGSAPDNADSASEGESEGGGGADTAEVIGTIGLDVTDAEGPLMVRSVELDLVVDDVSAAVTRARATVVGSGGWVSSEDVRPGTDDRSGYGSLVLRVPSADLDAVVGSLEEIGEVQGSRSSAEDVTTEYRDVEARVSTLEAGAERLRELVAEASSVESIATLESELSMREAELDSLKARLKVLSEDISRSTITLHLAEESETLAAITPDTGFMAGLNQGWEAFTASVTVLLTTFGALLPFLVLLVLLVLPVLWWRRRRGQAAGAGTAADAPAAAEPEVERSDSAR